MRRRRPKRRRILLVLGGLLLLLLAAEIVVRAADLVRIDPGVATPEQAAFNAADMFVGAGAGLSFRNRPHAETRVEGRAGELLYRHDARGWRITPAPGGERARPAVAFLGDSTSYGLGLDEPHTLPARTAAALAAAGVPIAPLNLGVCGYGTAQEVALYEADREALAEAGAGVVVLVFFPNDFARGRFRWDSPMRLMYLDPLPLPHAAKGLLFRSALYRALVSALGRRETTRRALDPANPANAPPALEAVARLADAVRRDGRRLLVAHLPAMERLDPYLFAEGVERLSARCAELGVPFVDLLPAFLAERERQVAALHARGGDVDAAQRANFLAQYWLDPRDHHLDARGTEVAAQALAAALRPLIGN